LVNEFQQKISQLEAQLQQKVQLIEGVLWKSVLWTKRLNDQAMPGLKDVPRMMKLPEYISKKRIDMMTSFIYLKLLHWHRCPTSCGSLWAGLW